MYIFLVILHIGKNHIGMIFQPMIHMDTLIVPTNIQRLIYQVLLTHKMDTRQLMSINYIENNSNSVSVDIPKYNWKNCRTFIDTRILVNINCVESNSNSVSIDIPKYDWKNCSTFKIYYKGVPVFRDTRYYSLKDIFNRK